MINAAFDAAFNFGRYAGTASRVVCVGYTTAARMKRTSRRIVQSGHFKLYVSLQSDRRAVASKTQRSKSPLYMQPA